MARHKDPNYRELIHFAALCSIYHCVVLKYSADIRNMQTPIIDDVVSETEGALRSHSYVLFLEGFNFLLHLTPLVFATLE